MARRNPTNQRYTHDKPAGKTRKSAAAAKPKRAAGDSSVSKTPAKGAAKDARRSRAQMIVHPPTPEYKRWRRIWFGLLGAAMVLATVSWWLWRTNEQLGLYVLVAAYVSIGVAIWVDWTKLRVLRAAYIAAGGKPVEPAGRTDATGDSTDDKS